MRGMSPQQIADQLIGLVDQTSTDAAWLSNMRMSVNVGDLPAAIADALDALAAQDARIPADLLDAVTAYKATLSDPLDRDIIKTN